MWSIIKRAFQKIWSVLFPAAYVCDHRDAQGRLYRETGERCPECEAWRAHK